jgi:Tol biopolymer transport system component/DNA-binding winged helix-turn-helix (wHTH) protein
VNTQPNIFTFGHFRLDTGESRLLLGAQAIPLEPQVLRTLQVLVENSGHLCEKAWLIEQVWGDTIVEEGNLARNISVLRKTLGDRANGNRFIETVPKRGYRFVASVIIEGADQMEPHSATGVTNRVSSSVQFQRSEARSPNRYRLVVGAIAVLLVTAFVIGRWRNSPGVTANTRLPFTSTKLVGLTSSGNATTSAISPDGKYVVYELEEGGHKSLWLRQVDVQSSMRLSQAGDGNHYGLIFSHDGNYLYYLIGRALYQMSVLGQAPKKLIENLDNSVSLSPDDRQIAFFRFSTTDRNRHELWMANSDGTNERLVAARVQPFSFGWFPFSGPAWSPDGKSIASIAMSTADKRTKATVIAVNVVDGKEQSFTSREWEYINQIAWLPDGSGLLFAGRDHASPFFQIWYVSYPSGEARQVTSDLNDYYNISLSADGHSLAVVQRIQLQNVWTAPAHQPEHFSQITRGAGSYPVVSWMPDGKILYDSHSSGSADVWIMDANGANQRQLTNNVFQNYSSTVTPDGRYILFHSNRTGTWQVWRTNIDGRIPTQLTDGEQEANLPQVSPDSRWVVYRSLGMIWKVPIDGGAPTQLTNKPSERAVFSPDGKYLACWYKANEDVQSRNIAILPATGNGKPTLTPLKLFSVPGDLILWHNFFLSELRWTPDSRAVAYLATRNGVNQIWVQSLQGGAPKQLTNFSSEKVVSFDWSRDNRLVVSRGSDKNDVILIKDLR